MAERQKYFEENKVEEQVVISQEDYNKYQDLKTELENEKNASQTWKEKYMNQVAQNKKLQEEKVDNKELEEEKKKFEQLMKEAQAVYDDSQKLEKGIIKLIKNLV